jgi:hypothetical protein
MALHEQYPGTQAPRSLISPVQKSVNKSTVKGETEMKAALAVIATMLAMTQPARADEVPERLDPAAFTAEAEALLFEILEV